MKSDFAIVIPSRMKSVRLPQKPLIKFNDVPMIVQVALTCAKVIDLKHIFVTTPDEIIIDTCRKNGIQAIKSSANALSGTDRLVDFSEAHEFKKIINVQGDELLLKDKTLRKFISDSINKQNCTVGVAKIENQTEIEKASVVKVACSNEKFIYASRSSVPSTVYSNRSVTFKHTGLYMFTKESLKLFSSFPQGLLEISEKIEILRLIENRVPVDVTEVEDYLFTIDTEEDVAQARLILEK